MDFEERVKHEYVENNGVKIHYATIGSGPLLVMIHGGFQIIGTPGGFRWRP